VRQRLEAVLAVDRDDDAKQQPSVARLLDAGGRLLQPRPAQRLRRGRLGRRGRAADAADREHASRRRKQRRLLDAGLLRGADEAARDAARAGFGDGERDLARLVRRLPEQVVERAAAEAHLARLRVGTPESLETTSLHLDILRDLKRINSHLTSVAYPILDAAGELVQSRLRTPTAGAK